MTKFVYLVVLIDQAKCYNTYIYVLSLVMLFVFNSSNSYFKVKYPYNSSYFCLDFI